MYDFKRFQKNGYAFQETVYRESWEDFYRVVGPDDSGPYLGILTPPMPGYAWQRANRVVEQGRHWTDIAHERLCRLYTCGEMYWPADRSRRFYLVTDWHEDGDRLIDRLESGPLSRQEALQIVADTATALNRLNEAGIHHGRINPDNVLIDDEGRARLTHPVEARLRAELEAVNSMGGSNWDFTFIAPEVASDRGEADLRSDLFSLCALLYHLLTGKKPFSSNTAFDLAPELLASLLPDNPGRQLTHPLQLMLAYGLRLTPAARYQHPRALLEDLRDLTNSRNPVHASAAMQGQPLWAGDQALLAIASSQTEDLGEARAVPTTRRRSVEQPRSDLDEFGTEPLPTAPPSRQHQRKSSSAQRRGNSSRPRLGTSQQRRKHSSGRLRSDARNGRRPISDRQRSSRPVSVLEQADPDSDAVKWSLMAFGLIVILLLTLVLSQILR